MGMGQKTEIRDFKGKINIESIFFMMKYAQLTG
jgi:hypothetical protein